MNIAIYSSSTNALGSSSAQLGYTSAHEDVEILDSAKPCRRKRREKLLRSLSKHRAHTKW